MQRSDVSPSTRSVASPTYAPAPKLTPMELDEWVSTDRLAAWSLDATDSLLATVADFAEDDPRWVCDYLPVVNPAIWEIAHVAWFAEWFVLRQLHGREPLLSDVDALYDSAAVPHITRWQLAYPGPEETRGYVRAVGEALAEVVADPQGLDSTGYFALYAIMHHDAHTEALTYTRQTMGWAPHPQLAARVSAPAQRPTWVMPRCQEAGSCSALRGNSRSLWTTNAGPTRFMWSRSRWRFRRSRWGSTESSWPTAATRGRSCGHRRGWSGAPQRRPMGPSIGAAMASTSTGCSISGVLWS